MTGRHALGVHIGHDRGAALVSNGELVAQIAEERLDRKKHSNSPELPLRSIRAVLELGHVRADELGTVGVSYTNVEIDRVVPLLRDELRDVLRTPTLDVVGVDHHDCHAWSAYYTSDVDAALVVVADGSGDVVGDRVEAESVYIASGDTIELADRRLQGVPLARMSRRNSFLLPYMHPVDRQKDISLGQKYEQFTYLVGFEEREAGKTMGIAAYGRPLFEIGVPDFRNLQFPLTFESALVEVDRVWRQAGVPWHRFARDRAADIAATGQELVERYMVGLLNALNPNGAQHALCAAGGVFLNCQMNGRILAETRFEHVHVVPAAGDDGQCVGAAFYAYQRAGGAIRRSSAALPFLGPCYAVDAVGRALALRGLPAEQLDDAALATRLAADLADGRVVGLLRGRSELGPRALCHRSILADPRVAGMPDHLNRLKGREAFRPFAPVVTEEDQARYFELDRVSPFMLFATRLRPELQPQLPAIVHVDGSSRVQAVDRRKEPFVHSLLRAFELRSGYPILVNTSFNGAGEPIVETPDDAISTFLNTDLDVLVLENFYVEKSVGR